MTMTNNGVEYTEADVIALADTVYAAQTTGVSEDVMNAAKIAVGIDPNTTFDEFGMDPAGTFLRDFGYLQGQSATFYNNQSLTQAPKDEGLAAHHSAVQTAVNEFGYLESTPENLEKYAGKIDPSTITEDNPDGFEYKFMVNDNIANQELINNHVQQNNVPTIANLENLSNYDSKLGETYEETELRSQGFRGGKPILQNSLQWAMSQFDKKKKPPLKEGTNFSTTSGAGIMPGYADVTPPVGGYVTPAANVPDSYREFVPAAGPANITPTSGTQAMNVPGYQNLFTNQVGQFVDRADAQQAYYQPQTMYEKIQQGGTAPGQIETRLFRNAQGMSMYITFIGGVPQQYIPPGYVEVTDQTTPIQTPQVPQQDSAQASQDAAQSGGSGIAQLKAGMLGGTNKLLDMLGQYNKGGAVRGYAPGGGVGGLQYSGAAPVTIGTTTVGQPTSEMADALVAGQQNMLLNAYLNQAGNVAATPVATMQPEQIAGSVVESTAGQAIPVAPIVTTPAQVGQVLQADPVTKTTTPAGSMTAQTAVGDVKTETAKLTGVTGDPTKTITAQTQDESSLDDVKAAQGTFIKINGPEGRQIQTDPVTGVSEIISGAANAHTAAAFSEAVQHAEATPSKQATVAGQLEKLMADFEGGETPAWAAGSMRTAMATLSARGLGASSLAGQAVIQAAMESALPIAQMDAQTMAQFEAQNLSNRQQRAMLAAQQRATFIGQEFDQAFQARVQNAAKIADIANMNFTADQQIALEDSRAANTMELGNLSNNQAVVMAEAAALANLDMANLNNRQQAEVQNAQNFLQMDMSNLSNLQQAAMFKSQQNVQALFTDQAAENAAEQFNATSENQTQQFFNNLASQTNQFNASQANAMQQFNVNEANALLEFNADLQSAREMFNAQNYLTVAQANAQWRQSVQTMNTAAINASNMEYAKQVNNISQAALDTIWQRDRDIMDYAWRSAESSLDRQKSILIAEMQAQAQVDQAKGSAFGKLLSIGGNYLMAALFPNQAAAIAAAAS